jgi:hypothetical protein
MDEEQKFLEAEKSLQTDISEEFKVKNLLYPFVYLAGEWQGSETIYDKDRIVQSMRNVKTSYKFEPQPIKGPVLPFLSETQVSNFDEYFDDNKEEYRNFGNSRFWESKEYENGESVEIIGYWHSKYRKVLIVDREKTINGWMGDIRHDALNRSIVRYWDYSNDASKFSYEFILIVSNEDSSISNLQSITYHYSNDRLIQKVVVDQTKKIV